MFVRLKLVLWLAICAGCGVGSYDATGLGSESATQQSVAPIGSEARVSVPAVSLQARWAQSCALCHVDGTGGAPRVGNAHEWRPRLEKGMNVLLRHTLDGFNQMPPLGYCMSCERDDFVAMIGLMTQGIDLKSSGTDKSKTTEPQ